MKWAVSLLALLLAGLLAAGAATPKQLERFSIGGKDYVRLGDWATTNGLKTTKVSNNEFRVANNSIRLQFTVNSQKASINGVTVWLSAPVAVYKNTPCLSLIDVQSTLRPLVIPFRNRKPLKQYTICLDPGHGGKDTGNIEGKYLEKDLTLQLARELSTQLKKAGHKVFLTRSWDTFVDLDERIEIAKDRGADLFISLHFNAASSDARGAEVYCMTPPRTASTNARGEGANTRSMPGNLQNAQNLLLAYQIQKAMVTQLQMEDRGVRRARWAVLRPAQMPAILVEGGFMSNQAENKNIVNSTWRTKLAQALAEGVKNYKKLADPAK